MKKVIKRYIPKYGMKQQHEAGEAQNVHRKLAPSILGGGREKGEKSEETVAQREVR
jgi:hypothetical protein